MLYILYILIFYMLCIFHIFCIFCIFCILKPYRLNVCGIILTLLATFRGTPTSFYSAGMLHRHECFKELGMDVLEFFASHNDLVKDLLRASSDGGLSTDAPMWRPPPRGVSGAIDVRGAHIVGLVTLATRREHRSVSTQWPHGGTT